MYVNPIQLQKAMFCCYSEIGPEAFSISPYALAAMYEGAIEHHFC